MDTYQKGLEVCYCLWVCHPDPRLGPILGPSRSHPGSQVVPSRFAMCFVLHCFGPIQVPRWGPSRPVLVPSWSRAFLPGSGLDGPKQTSWPLLNIIRNTESLFLHNCGFYRDRKKTMTARDPTGCCAFFSTCRKRGYAKGGRSLFSVSVTFW